MKSTKYKPILKDLWTATFPYLVILLLFGLMRFVFYLVNRDFFAPMETGRALHTFLFGARLDLIVAFYILVPTIVLLRLKVNRALVSVFFFTILFAGIILTVIDFLYFGFLKEHIGADFFHLLNGSNNISLWTYIKDYFLFAIASMLAMFIVIKTLLPFFKRIRNVSWPVITSIFVLTFFVSRGGFRSKPIRTVDAAQSISYPHSILAVNTPLYLYESWANPIGQADLPDSVSPNLKATDFGVASGPTPMNVVVVILESFGEEYTAENQGYGKNFTPFLNELGDESILCWSAFANGLKSVDAVPAIFSGIPRLSTSPFIHSPQSANAYPSMFNLLDTLGYTSLFFHGADNHTMGFQSYLKNQGLQNYYGIEEYPNKNRDFDGHWGIYDEPYLQYVRAQLNRTEAPFVAGVFTLTSHHPYPIPDDKKGMFPKGNLDIHESIGYTDYALRCFMDSCRKEPWFDNTLFVITADHSAENQMHAYRTPAGKYEIPMLFYSPKRFSGVRVFKTVSQIDILPTVLDLVNYPGEVTTLGTSIFDPHSNGATHFDNQTFHVVKDSLSFGLIPPKTEFLYNRLSDINCLNNLDDSLRGSADQMRHLLFQNLANYHHFLESQANRE